MPEMSLKKFLRLLVIGSPRRIDKMPACDTSGPYIMHLTRFGVVDWVIRFSFENGGV
jgi:hypothetical protein